MPTVVNGLPAHILLVHVVIAIVPVAAVLVLIAGVWPAARRWLNWLPALAALAALAAVPITTNAGHWLQHHLRFPVNPAIQHHINLGNQMLPWVIALFVASLVVWAAAVLEGHRTLAIGARRRPNAGAPSSGSTVHASTGTTTTSPAVVRATARRRLALRVVVAVIAVVAAVGSVQQVYRTGEAGSRAVWSGTFDK
ncbi:MAG TPA: hypothetical protein VF218_01130 [Acidothermaceae bacterium]|jgi:hypothetical protein